MRYAYILIKQELNRPPTKRDDFQYHVLGVYSNLAKSLDHFDACIRYAEKSGFKVLRRDMSDYERRKQTFPNEPVAIVYMEHNNKTLEYKVERYKLN